MRILAKRTIYRRFVLRTIMNCGFLDRECELFLIAMPTRPKPPPPLEEAEKAEPLTISSEALLGGRRQVVIVHGDERYRLLLTRSNKLILTK